MKGGRQSSREFINTQIAAHRACVSKACIRSWAKKYQIGKKVAGRWYINAKLLDLIIKGYRPDRLHEIAKKHEERRQK